MSPSFFECLLAYLLLSVAHSVPYTDLVCRGNPYSASNHLLHTRKHYILVKNMIQALMSHCCTCLALAASPFEVSVIRIIHFLGPDYYKLCPTRSTYESKLAPAQAIRHVMAEFSLYV
jgi:hypothetical protein